MSNAARIVRRNIARLEGPADPFDRRLRPRSDSTVYKVTDTKTGAVRYESDGGVKVSFPYRCAVRRKPYRGNSERMRRAE